VKAILKNFGKCQMVKHRGGLGTAATTGRLRRRDVPAHLKELSLLPHTTSFPQCRAPPTGHPLFPTLSLLSAHSRLASEKPAADLHRHIHRRLLSGVLSSSAVVV
jgi:hypothetical protein